MNIIHSTERQPRIGEVYLMNFGGEGSDTGLLKDSIVLCENPERMSKQRIGNYITTLSADYMSQIAISSLLASSAISFMNPDDLLSVWQQATELNTVA